MNPDLKERLMSVAHWHDNRAKKLEGLDQIKAAEHRVFAADVRAAITSAEDALRNLWIEREHKANRRRFDECPAAPSAFGGL